MRPTPNIRVETYRKVHPILGGSDAGENWGYFEIPTLSGVLRVIATDGIDPDADGWEHVSVSLEDRTPTWEQMALVKNLFWTEEETVVQFHPRRDAYVNRMPFCLHLWRRAGREFELPSRKLIG